MVPEVLSGDNQYQCDVCCGLKDARKTVRVVSAPRLLLLVLLRFKYDSSSGCKKKLTSLVEYPDVLSLEVEGSSVEYKLHAVVVHTGEDCQGGHYFTWVRQKVLLLTSPLLTFVS